MHETDPVGHRTTDYFGHGAVETNCIGHMSEENNSVDAGPKRLILLDKGRRD